MDSALQKLIEELVRIPSVTANRQACNQILDFADQYFDSRFERVWFEQNGVKSLIVHNQPKNTKLFSLLLNGHLDVVPANANQFNPVIKDDKMHARGTGDMKSGAAIAMQLFNKYAAKADYSMAISLVTDEEIGGFDGAGVQTAQGYNGEFVLVTEPTALQLGYIAKGVCWFELHANGERGHGSQPWNYASASERLLIAVNTLRDKYPMPKKEVWRTTINIAGIDVPHEAANQIADKATATIDCRYTSDDDLFGAVQTVDGVRRKIQKLVGNDVEVVVKIFEAGVETSQDHPKLTMLADCIEAVTKQSPAFYKEHGFTDIRFFTNKGANGVVFGPHGYNHHGDKEAVNMNSVQAAYEVIGKFVESYSS